MVRHHEREDAERDDPGEACDGDDELRQHVVPHFLLLTIRAFAAFVNGEDIAARLTI
jgi:hypothetical protein